MNKLAFPSRDFSKDSTLFASLSVFFSDSDSKKHRRFLIACSGGADSVALLAALASVSLPQKKQFVVGHVNHSLRGRFSDADATFVKNISRKLGFPFVGVRVRLANRGNLEEEARLCRYRALGLLAKRTGCTAVLTAHTKNDQMETVLLNLFRGAGPDGLAGLQAWRTLSFCSVPVGRPLLALQKKELEQFLRRRKTTWRSDLSNKDISFTRNWLRQRLLPLLERRFPGFANRLVQTAGLISDEQQFWDTSILPAMKPLSRPYRGGQLLDLKKLLSYPAAAQRRFLRHLVGRDLLAYDGIEKWRQWMMKPPTGGRLWELRKGWVVERLSRSKGASSSWLFWLRRNLEHNH